MKLTSSFGTEPTIFAPLIPRPLIESSEDPSPQQLINDLLRTHLPQTPSMADLVSKFADNFYLLIAFEMEAPIIELKHLKYNTSLDPE